jgi:hypothetical protein
MERLRRRVELLARHLQMTVPMVFAIVRDYPDDYRYERGRQCARTVTEYGDELMFGGKMCREAVARLAEVLAIAAFAPGGIEFCGWRWLADDSGRLLIEPSSDAMCQRLDRAQ